MAFLFLLVLVGRVAGDFSLLEISVRHVLVVFPGFFSVSPCSKQRQVLGGGKDRRDKRESLEG